MSEINQVLHQTVRISGQGDNKQVAFGDALNSIRKQLTSDSNNLTVRIVPQKIVVVSATAESYKEHFLFFFFPRVRTSYKVVLDVDVEITMVNLDLVEFTDQTIASSDRLPLANFKALFKGEK